MEVGRHRGMMANKPITVVINTYEKVKIIKYSSSLLKNGSYTHEEIICRFKTENSCSYSAQTI